MSARYVPGAGRRACAGGQEAAALRRRLIQSNLRLVPPIARKLAAGGQSLLELVQEGNLGLLRAAEEYDPAKGYRFATFATWWIRDAIIRAPAGLSVSGPCAG